MTIVQVKFSAFTGSCGNIMHVSMWNTIFGSDASMKFFPGEYDRIVDLKIEDNGLVKYCTYPFTDIGLVEPLVEAHEERLTAMIKATNRPFLTVILYEDRVEELTQEMFKNFFPNYILQPELFIFIMPEELGGFPSIYYMPKEGRVGNTIHFLDTVARCAVEVYKPADKQTKFGKELTYILYASKLQGSFTTNRPDLKDIYLPSNGLEVVDPTLNTVKLMEIIDKITAVKKPDEKAPVTSLVSQVIDVDETEEEDTKVYGGVLTSSEELEEILINDVLTKQCINLSDMFNMGLETTIQILGKVDYVVDVFIDMPEAGRKMCVFEGKIYLIPNSEGFSPADFFDEPEDLFKLCTEDSYPKNLFRK